MVWSGFRVDPYLLHVRGIPLPHPYPTRGVLTMAGVLTGETLLVYGVIRPRSYARSWGRALLALAVCLGLFVFFGLLLMHTPPFMVAHCLWLGATALAMLGLLAASIAAALKARAPDPTRWGDRCSAF